MKYQQFNKAISYMDTMASAYGEFPFIVLSDLENDTALAKAFSESNPEFFSSVFPALLAKSEAFYTPEKDSLINAINEMGENDQKIRMSKNFEDYRETDSINYVKLLKIIDKYGFPDARLYGRKNYAIYVKISALIVHQSTKNQNLQEILIMSVREGKCAPSLYGFFVDHKMFNERKKYIFSTYSGIKDNEIFDLEYLDKRRLFIGMKTVELERRREELLKKNRNE
jgi:hypothetical protein